jgi:hypothetical protein
MEWASTFHEFRRRLFLFVIEPLIVIALGPGTNDENVNDNDYDGMSMTMGGTGTSEEADNTYYMSNAFGATSTSSSTSSLSHAASSVSASVDQDHRRLGFLPAYVENATYYGETSMSFASFFMLFFMLGLLMLVFLSCFFHNQKTSPLFISPRRHRLPKLVPPPLPVDSFFSWIKVMLFMADEEVRSWSGGAGFELFLLFLD